MNNLRAHLASKISHMKFIPKLEFVSSDVLIEQEAELAETEKLIDEAEEQLEHLENLEIDDDLDEAMEVRIF